MPDDKGPGQGKGAFTRAGVQREQAQDIDSLNERVTAIEDYLEAQTATFETPEPPTA